VFLKNQDLNILYGFKLLVNERSSKRRKEGIMKKKFLKLKDVLNLVQNSRTKQFSYNIKKRQLQLAGISPRAFLNMRIPLKDFPHNKRRLPW